MTEPIFHFGSFTDSEAYQLQTSSVSVLKSASPKVKHSLQKPALPAKENGNCAHKDSSLRSPPPKGAPTTVGQNGVGAAAAAAPKGAQNPKSRVAGNGKQNPESLAGAPARAAAARVGVKKPPGTTSIAVGTGGVRSTGKQVEVKAPGASKVPNVGNHTSGIEKELTVSDAADQADWMVLGSHDLSDSKSEASWQGPPFAVVTPLKHSIRTESGTLRSKEVAKLSVSEPANSEPTVLEMSSHARKEVSEETLTRTTSGDDLEAGFSGLMPKSWAALVGVSSDSLDTLGATSPSKKNSKNSQKLTSASALPQKQIVPVTALSGDIWLASLREADATGRRLLPRGLINTGNSCFLNSTMQAMLSCPAFTHLLQVLKARNIPQLGYPTLRALVDFAGEFEPYPETKAVKARPDGKVPPLEVGKPFVPAMFDTVLQSFTPDQPLRTKGGRNRQEDAQEFLSFVIDRIHEEILRLQGKNSPAEQLASSITSLEDEDWEMVGPKNRTSVTRTHTSVESAITDIFGGQLRSVVKTKGNKASATVQPFMVLHLDIVPDVVHSVEDALRMFAAPESLEGYKPRTSKVGEVVQASKSLKLQTLPRVLILHLMRFSYGSNGSSKLHKPVQFPLEFTLARELLASPTGNETRRYELTATVSHHGKDPSVGHYTADSKQASGQWLRFDDGAVSTVNVHRVLQEQVYVLFYKRLGL